MNQEKFVVELKQLICNADWHRRYHAAQATHYNRINYWFRSIFGIIALVGAALSTNAEYRAVGAIVAGASAFVIASVLPIFKWDDIIAGLNEAEDDWTRILKGYQTVESFYEISDRAEILVQEFQRVKDMQSAAAMNGKQLPINKKLLRQKELETQRYYGCEE